jgi:aspartyl/asparaginyl beta-hydroxylase (cupin superfamily)
MLFPLARELEENGNRIADEFKGLARHLFQPEAENIKRTGNWDVFFLFDRGRKNDKNCAEVPVTTAIIEANQTFRTSGGLIYFSRLAPNTVIAPHRGLTNMRLRCHLGISIPDNCGISVEGISETWEESKCLVFDDSFLHEAWNGSDRERIVLIVDFWHPELSEDEVCLLEALQRQVDDTARTLVRYWERNDQFSQPFAH